MEDEKKGVNAGARKASTRQVVILSLTSPLGDEGEGVEAPHLARPQPLETIFCPFQHETPDKDTEEDDVGKENQDIQHLGRKYALESSTKAKAGIEGPKL